MSKQLHSFLFIYQIICSTQLSFIAIFATRWIIKFNIDYCTFHIESNIQVV